MKTVVNTFILTCVLVFYLCTAKRYKEPSLLSNADIRFINYLLNVTEPVDLGKNLLGCKMLEDPYRLPVFTFDDKYRSRTVPIMACNNVTYPRSVRFYGDIILTDNLGDVCTDASFFRQKRFPHCVNKCLGADGATRTFTSYESMYCSMCGNRQNATDNFLEFHHLVRDGYCAASPQNQTRLYLPYMEACSGISQGVNMFGGQSDKFLSRFAYRTCYCHNENAYAKNQCNKLYISGLRRLDDATKYIIFIVCIILLLFTIPLVFVPMLYVVIKNFIAANQISGKIAENFKQFLEMKILSVTYMILGVVLLAIENIVSISPTGYKFAPLRPLAQFLQLFSIFHIAILWIYLLNVAETNENKWPLLLKIVFASFYVLMVGLVVTLYVIIIVVQHANTNADVRLANIVILYFAFLLTVTVCGTLIVYGIRMFMRLNVTQKAKFYSFKFTRYMIIAVILTCITIIFAIVAVGFDYSDNRFVRSNAVYYDIRFFFLDIALLAALYSLVYLVFDKDTLLKIYFCKEPEAN